MPQHRYQVKQVLSADLLLLQVFTMARQVHTGHEGYALVMFVRALEEAIEKGHPLEMPAVDPRSTPGIRRA